MSPAITRPGEDGPESSTRGGGGRPASPLGTSLAPALGPTTPPQFSASPNKPTRTPLRVQVRPRGQRYGQI